MTALRLVVHGRAASIAGDDRGHEK